MGSTGCHRIGPLEAQAEVESEVDACERKGGRARRGRGSTRMAVPAMQVWQSLGGEQGTGAAGRALSPLFTQ